MDYTHEAWPKVANTFDQDVNVPSQWLHIPAVGLDDVFHKIDNAELAATEIECCGVKHCFIGGSLREVLRNQTAFVQELEEA